MFHLRILSTMKATTDELEELIEQKVEERTSHLHDRIDKLESTVEHLESELEVQSGNVRGAHARIGKVEDKQDTETTPEPDNPTLEASEDTSTPLEQIVSLPEHMANRELTANQERARFVASDVKDYADKVPAGFVMSSRTIRKLLTTYLGKRPHNQTVARVMERLDELGKDDVQLKKRRGNKIVVFTNDIVQRVSRRCDRDRAGTPQTDVISS